MVGLTTTEASFIEEAQAHGQLYIEQPYELYSEENHEAWRLLFARMQDRWRKYGNVHFLKGSKRYASIPLAFRASAT